VTAESKTRLRLRACGLALLLCPAAVAAERLDKKAQEWLQDVRLLILPEEEASYRPRQFPFAPESFCMWGSRPDIPEFRADQKDKKPPLKTVA